MKLSIIIVNYNTSAITKSLIESLLSHELPRDTEIIVVDNNSEDESVAFLRSDFPEIIVIDNHENVGLAAGINTALQEAKGEYVFNLNPDMIAMEGSVMRLVSFMDGNPYVGIVGAKLISPSGKLQYSCFRFYRPITIVYRRTRLGKTRAGKKEIARFVMKDFDHTTTRDVDWLLGACLFIRSKAIKQVGPMDERYFLYFEDVDWCRRMWEAGWRVTYMPKSVFSHFFQQSSRHGLFGILTNRPTREHIKSAIKYFMKFRGKKLPHSA